MTTDNVFSTYDMMSDLAANRPATPTVANGRLCMFMATDTGIVSIWNGSGWNALPTDYQEGSWTLTDASGAGLSFSVSRAKFRKVGSLVLVDALWTYPVTTSSANAAITGLPFAAPMNVFAVSMTNLGKYFLDIFAGGNTGYFVSVSAGTNVPNSNLSNSTVTITAVYPTD